MDRKKCVRVADLCALEQPFEHDRVGVLAHDPSELDDKWRAGFDCAAKQSVNLLQVTDIESPQGVLSVGRTEQIDGGQTHNLSLKEARFLKGRCKGPEPEIP